MKLEHKNITKIYIDIVIIPTLFISSISVSKKPLNFVDNLIRTKKFKSISDYDYHLKFSSLPLEAELMKKDASLKEKRDRWHESLSKDIYVEEALNVLDDLQSKPVVKKTISGKMTKGKLVKS